MTSPKGSAGLTATTRDRADVRKNGPEAAGSYTLSNFPEIARYEQRCKLCRLVSTAPDLLKAMHAEWARGVGSKVLWAEFLERVTAAAPGETFSAHTFHRHHDNHVAPRDSTQAATAAHAAQIPTGRDSLAMILVPPEQPRVTEMVRALPTLTAAPSGVSDADYVELWAMYGKLKPIVEKLCDATLKKLEPNAEGKTEGVSSYDAIMLGRLYGEARGTLADLNKIKNSDRLITYIVEQACRQTILRAGEAVTASFLDIQGKLTRGDLLGASSALVDILGGGLAPALSEAAREGLALTVNQYRLN